MKKHLSCSKLFLLLIAVILISVVDNNLLAQQNQISNTEKKIRENLLDNQLKAVDAIVEKELQLQINENITKYRQSKSKKTSLKSAMGVTAISQADSLVLVDLFNATNGTNWTNKTNWLTANPIKTWFGITVISDKVTEIKLKKNNLSGTIPANLGQLSTLEYLALDTNHLTGTIPVELGSLTNLDFLYLSGNNLTGTIPVQLGQLSQLSLLYLSNNQLSGTIPSELGQLSNLRWFNLSNNKFNGSIPTGLGQLTNLEFLDLSKNLLTGSIPGELNQLTKLKWLPLNNNQLTGSIPNFGAIPNLSLLYLNSNLLTGSIPKYLGQLTALQWLNLGQNQLNDTIPAELGNLSILSLLYLNENHLTGSIPNEFGKLTTLQWLNLNVNQLSGSIPSGLGLLTNLSLLYLNGNLLTGSIPTEIGQLTNLRWLFLNSNHLTGSIPSIISSMDNLEYMDVESNQLDVIPDLTAPKKLSDLIASNNKFSYEDLEYNMDLTKKVNFVYSPQDSIGENQLVTKNIAENFSYTLTTGGTQNNYQWFKDGNILASQTSATLAINNLALGDAGKYYCEVTNTLVSGLTLTSRKITLSVIDPNETIAISFNAGWNIFSSPVMPEDKNLKNILQPLIDSGQLKKVMDESGNVIEDWGTFGGWVNKIGDIKETEGYKINIISPTTLNITGILTQLPFNIPLKKGWNIISWPSMTKQDGQAVFQLLIDGGYLKKVMDEKGLVIEDWGTFGGWVNKIGNLLPGEGYKVNVNSDCTLNITVPVPVTKSEEIIPQLINSTHFIPAYKGNGTDHMNINLVNLAESGLNEGNEIGIFDKDICVGSAKISIQHSAFNIQNFAISIPVSACDEGNTTNNGFKPGNKIILKLYREGKEYPLSLIPVNNSSPIFEKNGTMFAKVDFGLNTGIELTENQQNISCYPNPFNKILNIEVKLSKQTDVTVEIYDLNSRKISQLYKGTTDQTLMLRWDGNDLQGNRVAPGIYICRVNDIWEKVMLNGN